MKTPEELMDQFNQITFSLSKDNILKFDKDDNGPLHNVITRINKHCFGVKLFEEENRISVEMFYVNNDYELTGDLIQLNIDDKSYFQLLLRFCTILADKYEDVNALVAFNTFQVKLRGFLEKLGFFTITTIELKPYKGMNSVMFGVSERGIKNVILIDHLDFYRNFFNDIYSLKINDNSEYVYLMVNSDTGHIKIGTSKIPRFREKTLQSQEPKIGIVALWQCDKKVEKELHEKFKMRRLRGEWFDLRLYELKELEKYMQNYNCS